LLDPQELGRQLAGIADTVGITISGGEPFEQAAACAVLAEAVRAGGKTVMVFSGCPFEQLKESPVPAVQRFLRSIDLIVAGPYLQELACESKLWRASSNQTVHFLTENEAGADTDAATPVMEVRTDGQQLSFTGFPESEDLTWFDRLSAALNSVGSPVNP
jgi:anaerobic ribonucleoside-triphosphate reductase activating protein